MTIQTKIAKKENDEAEIGKICLRCQLMRRIGPGIES